MAVIVGVCVVVATRTSDFANLARKRTQERKRDCASLAHAGPAQAAVEVCEQEFLQTEDPKIGALLVHVLHKSGAIPEAKRIATSLLSSTARPDVLQILGKIAGEEHRGNDAVIALETARNLHRLLGDRLELARDDALLGQFRTDRSEYALALKSLAECLDNLQGHTEQERAQEWHCRTEMARTLLTLGYYTQAQLEIDSAKALVTNDLQGAYLEYQAGSMAQDTGQHTKAIAIFTRVLPVLQHARDIDQTLITQENLAYSLAVVGKFVEARQHLDTAVQLDVNHRQDRERTWTAAKLAYEEHDLPNAIALTDQYFEGRSGAGADADPDDDPEDVDDRIEVAVLRAQIELDLNHLGSAERWAGRAIDLVEHIREQPVLALRPWVLAKRRVPYELRFTALARAGSIDDAVMVFDQLQGRTVQDALARGRQSAALGAFEIADQVTRLDTWGQASKAPLARSTDPKAVLSTMRSIDLLAVIIAGDHVWRLTSHHGPARLAAVGSVKDLEERIRRFSSHPSTETALATELGALLLPDDLFRKTPETLHVIVDDRLAELPVAALRHGTTPLFEVRPSVRELRLPEVGCVPAASALHAGHATVLGDPLGVRTYARAEAEQVAALLGTESKTGAAATTAALFAASSDGVLHVAAETQSGTDGAALLLGDRELPALEIAAHSSAPSLVVLSACSAATVGSEHPEVYGSLGAAFLAAGAQHVVAPLRSISDAGTPDVIMRFYRARGVADPVRALQAAQVELSKTDNADWPLFAVFGPDVCL